MNNNPPEDTLPEDSLPEDHWTEVEPPQEVSLGADLLREELQQPGLENHGRASDDKRTEVLFDHYKDTYQVLLGYSKERDRFFLYILLLIAIIGVDCLSRGTLSHLINAYVAAQVAPDLWKELEFTAIVHLMVSFLFFYFVSRYYQRCMLLDRVYRYLSACEDQLNAWLGGAYVTREGRAYRSRAGVPTNNGERERPPSFLRCVELQYYIIFPSAIIALVCYLSYRSVDALQALRLADPLPALRNALPMLSPTDVLTLLLHLAIIGYSLLYLAWVLFNRRKKVEKGARHQI